MEVVTLERTLTELDHVRLLNLLRRDARGEGSPAQTQAIEEMLEASAVVPSREVTVSWIMVESPVVRHAGVVCVRETSGRRERNRSW